MEPAGSVMKHSMTNLFPFVWGQLERKTEWGKEGGKQKERETEKSRTGKERAWYQVFWRNIKKNKPTVEKINWMSEEGLRVFPREERIGRSWRMLRQKKSLSGILEPQEGHSVSTEECQPKGWIPGKGDAVEQHTEVCSNGRLTRSQLGFSKSSECCGHSWLLQASRLLIRRNR